MSTLSNLEQRMAVRYEADVAAGLHDQECEQGASFWICNCRKRRRVATGLTTPPTEDLYFPPPDCTHCDRELSHDGDSWRCYDCHLSWNSDGRGDSAEFDDDMGDLSPCAEHGIRAHVACEVTK